MRIVSATLALAVSLLVAGNLLAAEKEKGKPHGDRGAGQEMGGPLSFLKGIDLTADQKSKLSNLMQEYKPKLVDTAKLFDSVLTPDQKKAREEAMKAAKDAGKGPKEIREAGRATVTLTDEQKAKLREVGKKVGPIYKEFHEKVMDVLTPEQKEQVKKKWESRKASASK